MGRLDAAARHVRELERDLLPAASASRTAEALWTASLVSHRQGDHATAQDRLETALSLLQGRDDLALWIRLRIAAAAAALDMSPPRPEARRRLDEVETVVELTGTPLQVQELHALRAHLAFHQGEPDKARALCRALLSDEELRLPYRDRARLLVLEGRLTVLDGRADEGIAALEQLGHQATGAGNLDLAAHVWQSLATALAQVRTPAVRERGGLRPQPSVTGAPRRVRLGASFPGSR